MSNVYRTFSSQRSRPPSRWGSGLKIVFGLLGVAGVCVIAILWFRKDVTAPVEATLAEEETDAAARFAVQEVFAPAEIEFVALNGQVASGVARRSHEYGTYAISIVASLPGIDSASQAYEAWFVTPGITDFFSLGELFPREDGKWGLAWSQSEELARNDIAAFNRIIVIREPRDGNLAPSPDQVMEAEF